MGFSRTQQEVRPPGIIPPKAQGHHLLQCQSTGPPKMPQMPPRGQSQPRRQFSHQLAGRGDGGGERGLRCPAAQLPCCPAAQPGFPPASAALLLAESTKLPAYGGGQKKVISIRWGSLRSQANTVKLCNTGSAATGVIYPPRGQSAWALQEAPLLQPPLPPQPPTSSFCRLKGKGKKRNRKSSLLLNSSSLQGE